MSNVHDDIEAQPTVSGNRLIEGGIKNRYQRFEIQPLTAWANANAWPVAAWRYLPDIDIDAQIEPRPLECFLDDLDNARLS